jgi:hypothetical protein
VTEPNPTKNPSNALPIYVLFNDTTTDFPGEWVVRKQTVVEGKVRRDKELTARGASREDCEAALFEAVPAARYMQFLDRWPNDDLCIAGTYL